MSDHKTRVPVRTARAEVLLTSVGGRGVLCDFYDEAAAEIYQDLLRDEDGTEEARGFAARIRPESGRVLELAAGSGRLTVPLLEMGLEVTALELSSAMLDILRSRLADVPSAVRDRCTVVQADMSAFALADRFGSVLLSPGTVELLDDADRPGLYASVRAHLEPGGRFLLNVTQPGAAKSKVMERSQEMPGASGRKYVLHARLSPREETRELTIHPADDTLDPFVICTSRFRILKVERMVRELGEAGFDVVEQVPLESAGVRHRDGFLLVATPRTGAS